MTGDPCPQASEQSTLADRFLSQPEVLAMIGGIGRSTLYRWIKENGFPAQRQLGEHRVGWLQSEVLGWMYGRPAVKPADLK